MIELLFPTEAQLVIEDVLVQAEKIDIYAKRASIQERCPNCQQISEKIHSTYQRHPYDLPCFGYRVQLHLSVRRFFCHHQNCMRCTFAETFSGLLRFKARRTQRLSQQQLAVAFAVSGEAGRRLLPALAMPLSGDTLIGDIRKMPEERMKTPRVLGIDDWAKKRGRTYGTILVDLETNRPLDLLDSREVGDVTAWLEQHPGIEIISRDRGWNYVKASSEGAPDAEQVADRWHLLNNLREAAETMLSRKPAALAAASKVDKPQVAHEDKKEIEEAPIVKSIDQKDEELELAAVEKPETKAEQAKAACHARRQTRFELVNQLYQEGHAMRAISRQLGLACRTVRKYVEVDVCPQYTTGYPHPSKLSSWLPYLEERWQAGYTNATQLWREIVALEFTGSRGLVSRWAAQERKLLPAKSRFSRQQPETIKPTLTKQSSSVPWSPPRAAWILVKDRTQLDDREKAVLTCMMDTDPQVALAADLTDRFVNMVKQKEADKLESWLMDAVASGIRSFISFANGIRQDFTAVYNALSMNWSNGPVEGHVNRLKFIKRIMYGRANFDLLRKRVLYQPSTA
jgi:transposase